MTPDVALATTLARRVLSKALDRLDELGPEERKKALRITLDDATAPEIFQAESSGDRDLAWHVLEVLEAEGVGTIRFGLAPRHGAREERKPAFEIALLPANEKRLRDFYGRARPGPTYGQQWRDLVQASTISRAAKTALAESPVMIEGRPATAVLERLLGIRELDRASSPLFLREVSSRVFWGISKILDGRGDLVAALLDKDECPFAEQPVHLCVDIRSEFAQILFIENKTTFERCIVAARHGASSQLPLDGVALVFASGFMGSARRLRTPSGSRLFFNGHSFGETNVADAFTSAFYSGEDVATTFWGDLDFAGMTILARLRTIFPSTTAWQPGYQPMVSRLEAGEGHLPDEAKKAGQRPILSTGCGFADGVLLPALTKYGRFLDQE